MCACGPPRMRSNSMAAAYNFELMSIIMIDAHRQLPASACTQACMHGRTRAHTHAHAHVCTQAHTHAPHAPRHVRLQARTHAPSPTQTLSHNRTANRTDCHEPPGEDVASRLQEFNETPPPNVMQTLVCTATAVFFMFLSIFLRRSKFQVQARARARAHTQTYSPRNITALPAPRSTNPRTHANAWYVCVCV